MFRDSSEKAWHETVEQSSAPSVQLLRDNTTHTLAMAASKFGTELLFQSMLISERVYYVKG